MNYKECLFRYPAMVMTVKLDGRLAQGSDDPDPKQFALAICDDYTKDQKWEMLGGKRSGKSVQNASIYFDTRKIRRLVESKMLGVQFELLEKDPFDEESDWECTAHETTNVKFYLSKLKYPPRKMDPLHIQFHFIDATLARKCDQVHPHLNPEWSRMDRNEAPFVFPPADTVFGFKPTRILEVKMAFENWTCTLGSEEAFQPYKAMNLNIMEHFPPQLEGKLDSSHVYDMLTTEKAFLAHIFHSTVSPDAPEAYAECK